MRWVCVLCSVLLKSTTSSLVLSMLSERVVLLAPFSQGTHLLSVGRLIVVVIRPITVVSSANLTMTLELCVAVQSCVYRQYRSGLRTQPCGAPVLRIRGDEVLLPILTTWLLPVRKSRIQLHRDLFSPRVWSFSTSVAGTMVLKCWTIIHEQHPYIGVLIFQVGESSVQGEGNSVVCGTVFSAVCKL